MRKFLVNLKYYNILVDYFKTIIKSKILIVLKYIRKKKNYIIIIEMKEKKTLINNIKLNIEECFGNVKESKNAIRNIRKLGKLKILIKIGKLRRITLNIT